MPYNPTQSNLIQPNIDIVSKSWKHLTVSKQIISRLFINYSLTNNLYNYKNVQRIIVKLLLLHSNT